MHILLTRPLEDSKELILRFSSLGHKVSHFPVIKIENIDYEEPDYNQYKGIIFTSANAIKNLNVSKIDKNINLTSCKSSTKDRVSYHFEQFHSRGNYKESSGVFRT